MAYPLFRVEGSNTASTSCVVTLPPHQAGWHIFVMAAQDNGATTISASGSWTSVVTQGQSGACRGAVFRLEATGSAETLTLSSSTNAAWAYVAIVVPDVLSATPVDGWQRTDWNNVATADTTSVAASSNSNLAITASEAGCLALVMWCADNGTSTSGPFMRSPFADMIEIGRVAENGITLIAGYRQLEGSGAIPTFRMQHTLATEGGNGIVVLLRNSVGGSRAPDCRTGETVFRYYGQFGNIDATTTWITPNDSVTPANGITGGAQIDGLDVNTTAGSHVTNVLLGPWGFLSTINLTQNTAGSWCGVMHTCAATDMSGKVLSVEHSTGVISGARFGEKGNIIVFKDGAGAWVAYTLGRRADYASANFIYTSHIAIDDATPLASSGTMDWTDVQAAAFLEHRVGISTGTNTFHFRNAFLWDTSKIVQGGTARPANWGILPRAMNQWGASGLVNLQGGSQILGKTKLQIGETTETTYFDSSDYSLELPPEYQVSPVDPLTSQTLWNANASSAALGVILKCSANDTINLNAGVMRAGVRQALTVDASASTSATVSTANQSVINWTPTWKTGIPIDNAAFKGCAKADLKGATVTNTAFTDTTATDAPVAFTATGGSMTGCTTDVTGTSAAYHIEVGDGGTGNFGITLASHTFTGTAGTDKVHVTNTAGTTTISISGTTTLVAGDVTTAGATVVIASDPVYQSVIVSGFTAGSRLQIYDTTNSVELFNGTASSGDTVISGSTATWTDPVAASGSRAIRVRVAYVSGASAKEFQELSGLTAGTSSGTATVTYPVTQVADQTYDTNAIDGSTITDVTFTDASPDRVNVDKAGGALTYPQLYAAFVYWISTATGIADDFAYIQAPDTANYIFTAMKIRNTSTTPLTLTGGYGRDATSGLVADIIDVAGSTGNIYPQPDHVVAFATGSGVTAQDKIDIANQTLTAAASTPINADLRKILGETFNGSGTESDPWGPV